MLHKRTTLRNWIFDRCAPARRGPLRAYGGFTLVELMIVVVILGILAAIVIPQFSNASQTARQNTLKDALRYLRTQITVYTAQHLDVAPGYPGGSPTTSPDQADFMNQMTLYTDANGNSNATYSDVFEFGPYLSQMPPNPMNDLTTIEMVNNGQAMPTADGSTGYIFQPQTGTILPNVPGNDSDGVAFSTY